MHDEKVRDRFLNFISDLLKRTRTISGKKILNALRSTVVDAERDAKLCYLDYLLGDIEVMTTLISLYNDEENPSGEDYERLLLLMDKYESELAEILSKECKCIFRK